jgi:hypothetical protein
MKTSKKAKYPTMQIVEGVRENGKVKQRTVAHLGVVKGKKRFMNLNIKKRFMMVLDMLLTSFSIYQDLMLF